MENKNFQRMWEASVMAVMNAEAVVAFNFANDSNMREKVGLAEKSAVFYYEKGIGTQFYYDVDEMKDAGKFGFKRYRDKNITKAWIKNAEKTIEKSDKAYRDFINADLKSEDAKELFKRFKKLIIVLQEPYSYYYACQPQYFQKIEEYVLEKLGKKFNEKITGEIYSTLTLSDELDPLGIEELEWLKIVELVKNDFPNKKKISKEDLSREIINKIKKHSDNYLYLGMEPGIDWDFDYYMKLLNKDLSLDVSNKIKEIKLKKQELKTKKKDLTQKYNLDNEIIDICNNLAMIGVTRLELRFAWTEIIFAYLEVLKEIGKRNVHPLLNSENAGQFKVDELEEVIFNNNSISKKEIENRGKAYLFYVKNLFESNNKLDFEFYSGQEAIEKKKELILEQELDVDEFKGTVACKGKIRGKVRLFTWIEEDLTSKMDEMKKGEILVAGQTRPFLMPAIRKAGAIVTDEGGITSHAAIISRELGVPCIIGAKIATKVLKTGDEIEVDAEEGVVRILKKG